MSYSTADEAIEAARKAVVDAEDLIEFDGQNCNDDDENWCPGWDGESHRCACGNRQVYWSAFKNDDGTFYAVATAN